MPRYIIKDFSGGINTESDSINLPNNVFDTLRDMVVRPGLVERRNGIRGGARVVTGITDLDNFGEFKLTNDSTTRRFIVVTDGNSIERYDYSGGSYSASSWGVDDSNTTSIDGYRAYMKVVNQGLRIGFDGLNYQQRAPVIQYINRPRFNNNASADIDDWVIADTKAPTISSAKITLGTTTGSPTNAMEGKYFIVVALEVDGYQEGWFMNNAGSSRKTQAGGSTVDSISITIDWNYSTDNKRVTGFYVYCAWAEDSSASDPDTGYYLIQRVDINDSNWTADTSPNYDIDLTLDKVSGANFPDGHECTGSDDAVYSIEEEVYTRRGVVYPTTSLEVDSYAHHVWVNGRHFISHPSWEYPIDYWPFDEKQVVLFSLIGEPDIFNHEHDYIDLSTKEGDPVTGLEALFGDLIVFKELNMFRISLNNTGNSLEWGVNEHFQKVGCIAPQSIVNGDGIIYFAGHDHIYAFDGRIAKPITKYRIASDYRSILANSYSQHSDYDEVYGVFDPKNRLVLFNFPIDGSVTCYVYDIDMDAWHTYLYDDEFVPVEQFVLGVDYDLLVGGGTAIYKLNAGATANDTEYFLPRLKTGWQPLNGDPGQEKKLKYIQIVNKSTNNITVKIYADYSGTASRTMTLTGNASQHIDMEDRPVVGRVFQVEVYPAATLDTTDVYTIYEIIMNYDLLEARG